MRERSSVFLISRSLAALPGGGGWRGGEGRGSGSLLHLTRFFSRGCGWLREQASEAGEQPPQVQLSTRSLGCDEQQSGNTSGPALQRPPTSPNLCSWPRDAAAMLCCHRALEPHRPHSSWPGWPVISSTWQCHFPAPEGRKMIRFPHPKIVWWGNRSPSRQLFAAVSMWRGKWQNF